MPRTCTLCNHSRRDGIDRALRAEDGRLRSSVSWGSSGPIRPAMAPGPEWSGLQGVPVPFRLCRLGGAEENANDV